MNPVTNSYSAAQRNSIMTAVAQSFIALRDGSNRIGDFNTLAAAFNIAIVRAESIGEPAVEVFRAAQQALLRADQTYDAMKVYWFSQSDMVDLAKGVQGYSELLAMSTEPQMKAAIAEAERRLQEGIHARLPGQATH